VRIGNAAALTDHTHTWPTVTLMPGVNTIEVTGVHAGTLYTDTVQWTLR
jgi:beta-galactosidase